ncbi:MAG TPA: hypothetical protein PK253_15690 [Spirochaetota bacterium]|nr:hypothetical protein [Spirochaetota bacterium]
MSLAYYISALHLAVSVGGWYQYLHYYGASDDITLEDDTLYGITMSALFVF